MNLEQHLRRQMIFSHSTFGPGARTDGVLDHIRKELVEVEASGGSAEEWVDVVILALDGLTRSLAFDFPARPIEHVAARACHLIAAKQGRNEEREWPDWRTADPGKAIEHKRGA